MLQTTDQPSWVIIRTLQTSTPWKTIGTSCRDIPFAAKLYESQQGEVERSGEGHRRWDDPSKATIRPRLRQHQHGDSPGCESVQPAALAAFVHAGITAQPHQGQGLGSTDL